LLLYRPEFESVISKSNMYLLYMLLVQAIHMAF
jgi:hypothetical protein